MTTQIDNEITKIMKSTDNGLTAGVTVDAVLNGALDLLMSLPERPERLRVSAADVTVDLDWRSPPVPQAAHTTAVRVDAPPQVAEPTHVDAPQEPLSTTHAVCAPTIGTFYHAKEPGAEPFVTVGTLVNPGQQIGIVEAMKLMLPVEADRAGRVVEVLVPDGQAVEYGERLLLIEPAGN